MDGVIGPKADVLLASEARRSGVLLEVAGRMRLGIADVLICDSFSIIAVVSPLLMVIDTAAGTDDAARGCDTPLCRASILRFSKH